MTAQMRTGPAAGDPEFRGIDPPALNQLAKQLQDAQNAIQGWLNAHRPPPGVSAAGYRQADQVARWAADQLGMLSRRYNYAIAHPSPGGGVDAPPPPVRPRTPGTGGGAPAGTPRPVQPPPRGTSPGPTPRGAGDIGGFPDRGAAAKAAKTDALAVLASVRDGEPVPGSVWKHLGANADDPDYTEHLYERLGPAATADLLRAAGRDERKLRAVRESLGMAGHHMTMDVKWLRAFLAEADRAGVRPAAVQVLLADGMSERTRAAIARLGLQEPGRAPQAAAPRATDVA